MSYIVKYCDDPNNPLLLNSDKVYEDTFGREFDEKRNEMDRFLVLADLFNIIQACYNDFKNPENRNSFCDVNKTTLSFVNAVYTMKETAEQFDIVKSVLQRYRNSTNWYRFILEYRNAAIHKGLFVKEIIKKSGESFIRASEFEKRVPNEYKKYKLKHMKKNVVLVEGEEYYSVDKAIDGAIEDILTLKEKVIETIFSSHVIPLTEWFLSKSVYIDGKYWYTFIVNEKIRDCCEPTFVLESYVSLLYRSAGTDYANRYLNELIQHKYQDFYDLNMIEK